MGMMPADLDRLPVKPTTGRAIVGLEPDYKLMAFAAASIVIANAVDEVQVRCPSGAQPIGCQRSRVAKP